MTRKHRTIIAGILALCAVAGSFALLRTTRVAAKPAAATASVTAQIAARERLLAKQEAALRRALAAPAGLTPSGGATPSPRIVYVRPAPRIVTIHRSGGEREGSGGFDD